jgi:hypothetical protein
MFLLPQGSIAIGYLTKMRPEVRLVNKNETRVFTAILAPPGTSSTVSIKLPYPHQPYRQPTCANVDCQQRTPAIAHVIGGGRVAS